VAEQTEVEVRPAKSPWPRRIAIWGAVLFAIGLIVWGFMRDSGREGTNLAGGDAVDALIPEDGAETLAQSQIGLDLAPGYTGTLSINGIEVPEDELVDDRQQYRLIWTPSENSSLGDLPPGENCAQASIWRIEDGPDNARVVSWCFNVT